MGTWKALKYPKIKFLDFKYVFLYIIVSYKIYVQLQISFILPLNILVQRPPFPTYYVTKDGNLIKKKDPTKDQFYGSIVPFSGFQYFCIYRIPKQACNLEFKIIWLKIISLWKKQGSSYKVIILAQPYFELKFWIGGYKIFLWTCAKNSNPIIDWFFEIELRIVLSRKKNCGRIVYSNIFFRGQILNGVLHGSLHCTDEYSVKWTISKWIRWKITNLWTFILHNRII